MPFIETVHDFCVRHGAPLERDRVRVDQDSFLLPDGASIRFNRIGADTLIEPSADPLTRLRARRKYFALKLERVQSDFAALKTALTCQTMIPFQWPEHEYGAGPPSGKEALLRLKTFAEEHRAVIAGIDAEIEALPEVQARRRHDEHNRELARQARILASDQRAEIEAIDL